jgi:DNA-binding IclR family transcriptional regulator
MKHQQAERRKEQQETGQAEKNGDGVRAVERALDILMAFTADGSQLTVAELLKRVDLSRPTLYRLLYTLEHSGFLVADGEPQQFRLGPSVAHLAHVWTSSLDLSELARPILRNLWEQTGETVALFVPQGAYRLCIAELPSPQPLSFKRGVGYQERIAVGASGRAILAHADIPAGKLQEYAQDTGVDLAAYSEELAQIRRRGYATSQDELLQGATAIAAPFFNTSGRVAGSVAVFGPSARLTPDRVADYGMLLATSAKAVSDALGRRPS